MHLTRLCLFLGRACGAGCSPERSYVDSRIMLIETSRVPLPNYQFRDYYNIL